MFDMVIHTRDEDGRWDIVDGLTEIIGRLSWSSRQKDFVALLASPDRMLAKAIARILIAQPTNFDSTLLTAGFTHQPPPARRLYCAIISNLPQQTDSTRQMLLQGMHDPVAGVRWQAAMAVGKAGWNDEASQSALLEKIDDTNQYVGAAAAHSLVQLNATNAAPTLYAKLKTALLSANPPIEVLEKQSREISSEFMGEENHAVSVLDPDHVEMHLYVSAEVTANMKRQAAMRLPPRPFRLPLANYDLSQALIEALGDLKYDPVADELFKLSGTDYEQAANDALTKLAPGRLTDTLTRESNLSPPR